jgi:hypothetical protein
MTVEEVEVRCDPWEIVVVAIVAVMKVKGLNLEVLRLSASLVSCCSYAESILRFPCNPEILAETSPSGETLIVSQRDF